jgi:hypothetical protein
MGCGTIEHFAHDPQFDEQFGGLALRGDQVQVAVDHVVGVLQDGGQGGGIGGGDGQLDLAAEFQPHEMDQGEAHRAFQFAGRFEDETTISGRQDARDRLADFFGQIVPAIIGGEPIRRVGVAMQGGVVGQGGFGLLASGRSLWNL